MNQIPSKKATGEQFRVTEKLTENRRLQIWQNGRVLFRGDVGILWNNLVGCNFETDAEWELYLRHMYTQGVQSGEIILKLEVRTPTGGVNVFPPFILPEFK